MRRGPVGGWGVGATSAANQDGPFTYCVVVLLFGRAVAFAIWAKVVPPRVEQEVTVAGDANVGTRELHELDRSDLH